MKTAKQLINERNREIIARVKSIQNNELMNCPQLAEKTRIGKNILKKLRYENKATHTGSIKKKPFLEALISSHMLDICNLIKERGVITEDDILELQRLADTKAKDKCLSETENWSSPEPSEKLTPCEGIPEEAPPVDWPSLRDQARECLSRALRFGDSSLIIAATEVLKFLEGSFVQ